MTEPLPHDSPLLERGPQGPTDWTLEVASDDLFSEDVRERLKKLFEEWQQEHGPDS